MKMRLWYIVVYVLVMVLKFYIELLGVIGVIGNCLEML